MGVIGMSSCRSTGQRPAPNPHNFRILRVEQHWTYLVVEALYPDCSDYESRKIMVFRDTTAAEMLQRTRLDPHFAPGGGPIARFEPTDLGWGLANDLACTMGSMA